MVEIDRGTMPIARSDFLQTSFERKMRAYLTAHAGKQHEKHFRWKTFRVLTVTTDHHRMQSMMEALRQLQVPNSMGAPLFVFTTRDNLRTSDPLAHEWNDGNGRETRGNWITPRMRGVRIAVRRAAHRSPRRGQVDQRDDRARLGWSSSFRQQIDIANRANAGSISR
jgi:hypothetical protein